VATRQSVRRRIDFTTGQAKLHDGLLDQAVLTGLGKREVGQRRTFYRCDARVVTCLGKILSPYFVP